MNRQTAIKQLEAINIELYDYNIELEHEPGGAYLVRRGNSPSTKSCIGWILDDSSSYKFVIKREGWDLQEAESLADALRVLTGTPMTPKEERQFLALRSEYDRTLYHFKKVGNRSSKCELILSDSFLSDGKPKKIELTFENYFGSTILRWDRKRDENAFTVSDLQNTEFLPLVSFFDTFTEALFYFRKIVGFDV